MTSLCISSTISISIIEDELPRFQVGEVALYRTIPVISATVIQLNLLEVLVVYIGTVLSSNCSFDSTH